MATVNRLPRLQCWLRLMIDWAAHRRLQTHLTRLPLPLGHPQLVTYCDVTFPACTLLHRQHCTQGYPDEQELSKSNSCQGEHYAVGRGLGLQGLIVWLCMTSGMYLQMHAPVSRECLDSELAANTFAQGKQ